MVKGRDSLVDDDGSVVVVVVVVVVLGRRVALVEGIVEGAEEEESEAVARSIEIMGRIVLLLVARGLKRPRMLSLDAMAGRCREN